MAEPLSPQRFPYVVEVQPGTYSWCACGRSRTQPFCDGSHAGTGITPVVETVTQKMRIPWCGCKRTKTPPRCDGSHARP